MDMPYNVYGGLQDNSSWVGASAYPGGIANAQWENMYGGDGFWMFADTSDPTYIYAESQGGNIGRVNRKTHESRDIQPLPGYKEGKLRYNWNTPIHLSPTQKGTVYIGAQFLFRTRDHGQTWQRISPDLTTNDPEKQKQEQSGGVTIDNSSAEMHATIYAIAESPKDPNLIWAGTDDGNLQITRDAGKTWKNVVGNVPGLPKNAWVSSIEAGHFDAGTAYATFDLHTFGDMKPYVYRTTDFGKTWTALAPADGSMKGYAHVVKEDLVNKEPPLRRHGDRPLDLARRRKAVGAVQGRRDAERRRARPRDPPARRRARHRHARARDLDRRRHHAPALADAGDAREGSRVRAGQGTSSSGCRPRADGSTATPRSKGPILPARRRSCTTRRSGTSSET